MLFLTHVLSSSLFLLSLSPLDQLLKVGWQTSIYPRCCTMTVCEHIHLRIDANSHACCMSSHAVNILAYTLIVEPLRQILQITNQKQSTHHLLQIVFRHQFMIHLFEEPHSHRLNIQNLFQDQGCQICSFPASVGKSAVFQWN